MKPHTRKYIVPDRVDTNKVFICQKAGNAVGIQFCFGQVSLNGRIVRLVNDNFFACIAH